MSLARVKFTEATESQLREFGQTILGLDVDEDMDAKAIRSLIKDSGYESTEIPVSEPTAVAPAGTIYAKSMRVVEEIVDGEKVERTQICIKIDAGAEKDGARGVPLGVNGLMMLVPRQEPVWVYEEYVHVLDNATERKAIKNSDDQITGFRDVKRFSYSLAQPAPETEHEAA